MIKGVIFDIDGVIVDSEPLHMEALFYALKRQVNRAEVIAIDELIGLTLDDTIARFGIDQDQVGVVKNLTVEYYLANVKPALIRPKMKQLWLALIAKGMKFGCVSSAEMSICAGNLSLLGIDCLSQVPVVAFESVAKSKPDPLPYLTMLDRLGLDAAEVLVLEDSDTGILSATTAGIGNVYAWPHRLSKSQHYQLARQIITDLDEIELFRGLMNG